MEARSERDDETVIGMIRAATLAVEFRALAREFPGARNGLLRRAAFESERVEALAKEILAGLVWRPVRPDL